MIGTTAARKVKAISSKAKADKAKKAPKILSGQAGPTEEWKHELAKYTAQVRFSGNGPGGQFAIEFALTVAPPHSSLSLALHRLKRLARRARLSSPQ